MNKRQAKKKRKNQFDKYCRNYKELKTMKKKWINETNKIYSRIIGKDILDFPNDDIDW